MTPSYSISIRKEVTKETRLVWCSTLSVFKQLIMTGDFTENKPRLESGLFAVTYLLVALTFDQSDSKLNCVQLSKRGCESYTGLDDVL